MKMILFLWTFRKTTSCYPKTQQKQQKQHFRLRVSQLAEFRRFSANLLQKWLKTAYFGVFYGFWRHMDENLAFETIWCQTKTFQGQLDVVEYKNNVFKTFGGLLSAVEAI